MNSYSRVIFSISLGATICPLFGATSVVDLLNRWDVAVEQNYTINTGETEGSTLVGGSFTPAATTQFGFNGGSVSDNTDAVLWLNNGIKTGTSTVNIQSGSVVSRVSVDSGRFNLQQAGNGATIETGNTAWSAALSDVGLSSSDMAFSTFQANSTYWAGLAANSTASAPGNGSFLFSATPTDIQGHQVAVFLVDASKLADGVSFDRLEANLGSAETLLVNVAGTGDIQVNLNFTNGFNNNESKIIFNFFEADSITLNGNVRGTVFAPFSDVIQNVNIDGGAVARNLTQAAETHDLHFDGYLPLIPEPSAAALSGLGVIFLLRRRR